MRFTKGINKSTFILISPGILYDMPGLILMCLKIHSRLHFPFAGILSLNYSSPLRKQTYTLLIHFSYTVWEELTSLQNLHIML